MARDRELVTQWQDSAPDMEYEEWLAAEIGIQRELMEEVPSDDLEWLEAALGFTLLIVMELQGLRK